MSRAAHRFHSATCLSDFPRHRRQISICAEHALRPLFTEYLRPGEMIYMLYSVYGLACSYTFGIIGIGIRAVRHEPSALPCKGAAVPCPGIAYAVICYALTVERYKQIAPVTGIVTVCYSILYRSKRADSIRIRFAAKYVSRFIICPYVRFTKYTVVFAGKLSERIVGVPANDCTLSTTYVCDTLPVPIPAAVPTAQLRGQHILWRMKILLLITHHLCKKCIQPAHNGQTEAICTSSYTHIANESVRYQMI